MSALFRSFCAFIQRSDINHFALLRSVAITLGRPPLLRLSDVNTCMPSEAFDVCCWIRQILDGTDDVA